MITPKQFIDIAVQVTGMARRTGPTLLTEEVKQAETAMGGGAAFSQTCRTLIAHSPSDHNEQITLPVITLQNLLRGAFRELEHTS